MKASHRATIILALTPKLVKLGFTSRDVVLDQFDVPDDAGSGTITETTAKRLTKAKDAALIGLADHFGLSVPDHFRALSEAAPVDADHIWSTANFRGWRRQFTQPFFRLFISHTSANAALANKFKERLAAFNISAFVAHEDIAPTREWQNEIEQALKSMDGLLALLTADFHNSLWTDQEIGCAVGRSVPIIPLSVDGTVPYGFIGKIQALKLARIPEEKMGIVICERLSNLPQSQPLMLDILVKEFENSGSYDRSFALVTMLHDVGKLSDEQLQRIFYAAIKNDQILPARHVAGKIESLFKKFGFHPNVHQAVSLYSYEESRDPRPNVKNWLAQFEIADQF